MTEIVRSAARVLDLLEYFASVQAPVSLAKVTAAFGMPKSSALGLLRTLTVRGYLLRDEEGNYALNEVFRRQGFGWGGNPLMRLTAMAKPVLERLSAQLGETTSLGMLTEDGKIRYLLQSLSTRPVRYEANLDRLNPVHCTAMGRILLAPMTRPQREAILRLQPFKAYTDNTVTDLAQLHTLMDQALERGWSLSAEEHEIGGTGVSVAIHDQQGRALVAMNVASISARFDSNFDAIIRLLKAEGQALQAQFQLPSS